MSKSQIVNQSLFSSALPNKQGRKTGREFKRGAAKGCRHSDEGRSVSETIHNIESQKNVGPMTEEDILTHSVSELERRKGLTQISYPWLSPVLFVRQNHDDISPEYLKELRLCMGLPLNAMCYVINLASDIVGGYERGRTIILSDAALQNPWLA